MLKSGCFIVLIGIALFLSMIAFRQAYFTIYHDNWADSYEKQKVMVVSNAKDSSSLLINGSYSRQFSFKPVVEYFFNGESRLDTLIWMRSAEIPRFQPGDSLEIEISKVYGRPTQGSDVDRVGTGVINLLQGVFFFVLGLLSFKYLMKNRQKGLKTGNK